MRRRKDRRRREGVGRGETENRTMGSETGGWMENEMGGRTRANRRHRQRRRGYKKIST